MDHLGCTHRTEHVNLISNWPSLPNGLFCYASPGHAAQDSQGFNANHGFFTYKHASKSTALQTWRNDQTTLPVETFAGNDFGAVPP